MPDWTLILTSFNAPPASPSAKSKKSSCFSSSIRSTDEAEAFKILFAIPTVWAIRRDTCETDPAFLATSVKRFESVSASCPEPPISFTEGSVSFLETYGNTEAFSPSAPSKFSLIHLLLFYSKAQLQNWQ